MECPVKWGGCSVGGDRGVASPSVLSVECGV